MQHSIQLLDLSTQTWVEDRYADISGLAKSDIIVRSVEDNFIAKASRKVASKRFKEFVDSSNFYKNIYLISPEKTILASSRDFSNGQRLPALYEDAYTHAINKMGLNEYATQTGFRHDEHYHYILISKIYEKSTYPLNPAFIKGALIAEINLDELIKVFYAGITIGQRGKVFLLDQEGNAIVRQYAQQTKQTLNNVLKTHSATSNPVILQTQGAQKTFLVHQMKKRPWVILGAINKSEFTQPAYEIAYKIMAIGGVGVLLTGALIWLLLRWSLAPIQRLAQTMTLVRQTKDYSLRAQSGSNDEIGTLIEVFNQILEQIGVREHQLEQSNEEAVRLNAQMRQYTEELEQAKQIAIKARDKAQHANRAKGDFLAKMSHELRTPLNSIIGLTNILLEEKIDAEHRDMLEVIKKSSSSLLDSVNDVLDLSKIENNAVILEKIPFDFAQTTKEVIETLYPLASPKSVRIEYDIEAGLPYVLGDRIRVTRILTNLIGNAIKYTIKGRVDVIVSYTSRSDEKIDILCEIEDTGIGIPKNRLESIFEKFTQADNTITRKFGGTGLGLSITKQLVEMMGGQISLKSTQGKGSRFSFTIGFEVADDLCIQAQKAKADTPNAPTKIQGLQNINNKVLIVDDHDMNLLFAKKLLSRLGFEQIDTATNGVEALDMFKNTHYGLLFMDCHMPDMDGYEATKQIRAYEAKTNRPVTKIIAMTADVMEGAQEACLNAGMDEYVTKPIQKDLLISRIQSWVDSKTKPSQVNVIEGQ